MPLVRLLERNRDARVIGTDHVAGEFERAGTRENGISDIYGPPRSLRRDARQMRTIEPQAHHRGAGRIEELG